MNITEANGGRFLPGPPDMDEKSWGALETDFLSPDGTEVRRYRLLYVKRQATIPELNGLDDYFFAYVQDMGLAALQHFPVFKAPNFGDDTVGELIDELDYARENHRPRLPETDPHQWAEDSVDQAAWQRAHVLAQTQFGPGKAASLEQRNR